MRGDTVLSIPKRRRRKRQSWVLAVDRLGTQRFFAAPACVVVVVIGVIYVTVAVPLSLRRSSSSAGSDMLLVQEWDAFPQNVGDLWPDHLNQHELLASLKNCVPARDSKCKKHMEYGSSQIRIGILRPPGILGDVFEDFVTQYVEMSRQTNTELHCIGLSRFDEAVQSFAYIVRPAILPLLLGAVDISLTTFGEDFMASEVSSVDLLGVVRQLLRWHCRLSHLAESTAILTISFDRMVTYPHESEEDLMEFLELSHVKQKDRYVNVDPLADLVLRRLDECTSLVMGMSASRRLANEAKQIVRDELSSGSCHLNPLIGGSIIPSRVTEIVHHFLAGDGVSPDICLKYPDAAICIPTSNAFR